MATKHTKLAVIGAGPGGYPAAFRAADLGMEVTLIDPEPNPGGVCLYRGCIPSKALLHAAAVLGEAENAKVMGISFSKPKVDTGKLAEWKKGVVDKLTGGIGQLANARKINYIQGTASFKDNKTLRIDSGGKEDGTLSFDYCIIATGSRPSGIPGFEVDNKNIMDSTGALELEDVPSSMLIIGGGYIGLEIGTVYSALGCKITVAEMLNGLIQGADRDLVSVLQKKLKSEFESILLKTKVSGVRKTKKGLKVTLETSKGEEERTFEKILVAVGRKPNSENIGIDNINIETDDKGFIRVDSRRKTSEDNIYAIGDVAGEPMLAHKATHEGRIVAEVIAGQDSVYEPAAVPAVIFTDPEIAWCGITEADAKEKGMDINVSKFNWGASGRAVTLNRTDGLTKIMSDSETGRILGVGIAGPGAGELISEGVHAMEMASTSYDVAMTIHPHPTLSETFMEAAEMFHGSSTHVFRKKKGKK